MTTAELILKARERRGWTQRQLASELKVQASLICRWENGAWPTQQNMHRLALALGVPVVKLIGTEASKPHKPKPRKKAA